MNKNSKKILAVGFRVDKKKGYVTGQAAMIDLFISLMERNGYNVIPVSLNYRLGGKTTVGKTSLLRILDYILIFSEILIRILVNPKSVLYISPVANKMGALRDIVVVWIAKKCGYKIFMQQFGNGFRRFYDSQHPKFQKIIDWYYSQATIITVEGEGTKKLYAGLKCVNKLETLPNGLPELNIKTPTLPRPLEPNENIHLLYLSNMIESKGYLDVLEAANILINEYHLPVKVVFAGKFMKVIDDEKFSSIEESETYFTKRIEKLGLKDNITYFPSLFGDEKATVFAKSHFFLLPTYYIFEGAPTAILEALAYGSTPVVTRHGLIPEMVSPLNAIFVEKKNPRDIANKIRLCINDGKKYNELSLNAYKHYKDNYTVEAYEKKLLNIYHHAIEGHE